MPAIPTISAREVDAARAAARIVVESHYKLSAWLRPGITLPQIDAFVAKTLDDQGARSCFLGYKIPKSPAFPSHACLSVNDCIVHGTAGYYTAPMKAGDILKVDIGAFFEGWVGDAAWTYVFGEKSPLIKRLTDCGKESLRRGVAQLQPRKPYINWAREVQSCVEAQPPEGYGFHLVRGLGGHGYGRRLHAPPFISNTVPTHVGEWPDSLTLAEPGTLIAVEPMIAIGTGQTVQPRKQWPVFTKDGSLAVHYEHDVLIGEDGPIILTDGLQDVTDVIT
jgi:methionyl aminopeptidase